MRLAILPEHGFKHKGNHYASLPWFGTKTVQKYAIKGSKYSGDYEPIVGVIELSLCNIVEIKIGGKTRFDMFENLLKQLFHSPLLDMKWL